MGRVVCAINASRQNNELTVDIDENEWTADAVQERHVSRVNVDDVSLLGGTFQDSNLAVDDVLGSFPMARIPTLPCLQTFETALRRRTLINQTCMIDDLAFRESLISASRSK